MADHHPRGRMTPAHDDPWISVSILGETVFDARAGLIMSERDKEDKGEEPFFAMGRQPGTLYTLYQINRAIRNNLLQLLVSVAVAVVAVLYREALWRLLTNIVGLGLVRLAITGVLGFVLVVVPLAKLSALIAAIYMYGCSLVWLSRVPNESSAEQQPVYWWAMLANGFQPQVPHEGFSDAGWRLNGKPWRILVKGDLRIPVFRKRASHPPAENDQKIYRQHRARIAAYCHLLEKCTGARSPYGIVMFGHSYSGVSIANEPGARKAFHNGLLLARKVIRDGAEHRDPPAPENENLCIGCPHGRPEKGTTTSICGTRFNWTPPHKYTLRRQEYEERKHLNDDDEYDEP